LRREETAQFARAFQFGHLRRDPRLQIAVDLGDFVGALAQFAEKPFRGVSVLVPIR